MRDDTWVLLGALLSVRMVVPAFAFLLVECWAFLWNHTLVQIAADRSTVPGNGPRHLNALVCSVAFQSIGDLSIMVF